MMPRILIVDDDQAVRIAIRVLLEHEGFEVMVADSGRRAIEVVEQVQFDLVIVDIFMPGMDGLQAIKAFHRPAPGLPIIAISGFRFPDTAAPAPDFLGMATKLGAARSLPKPFRSVDLLEAVEACLPEHAGMRQMVLPRRAPGLQHGD
jgi:CheY-like chemotaxis protein